MRLIDADAERLPGGGAGAAGERDGYVSAPDLIRVLRDEYEIDIVGG